MESKLRERIMRLFLLVKAKAKHSSWDFEWSIRSKDWAGCRCKQVSAPARAPEH